MIVPPSMTIEEIIARCIVEAARRVTRVRLRECDGFRKRKKHRDLEGYYMHFRMWALRVEQQLGATYAEHD